MKNVTELVMILDRSGSMGGLESDTIGGFNAMIEEQKTKEGEALVSVVLFDHLCEVLYDRAPLSKVEPMTRAQYFVRGSTALLDAMGGAIDKIRTIHKYARPEDVPEKTLFIIITDGQENASRRYSYERVKAMIEEQKEKEHWEFLFLGANMDAVAEAARFGIAPSRAVRYENDAEGTRVNYQAVSAAVSAARVAKSAREMGQAYDQDTVLAPIRENYKKRKKRR